MVAESLRTAGKIQSSDSKTCEWWQTVYEQLARYRVQTAKRVSGGREYEQLARYRVQTVKRVSGGRQSTNSWQDTRYTAETVNGESGGRELPKCISKHSFPFSAKINNVRS